MTEAFEVNFDGIIGTTHNYAGLSLGNVASLKNKASCAHPKQAVLQALEKMRFLSDLGLKQAVIPPQERPFIPPLRAIGYTGSDEDIVEKVGREHPHLLAQCCSASSMWAANVATVCPSADSADGRLHLTPANLSFNFHRSLEPLITQNYLRSVFRAEGAFVVHDALPSHELFADEGAANHTRFCAEHGGPGIHLFTYGRHAGKKEKPTKVFPARQSFEASEAVARLHGIPEERLLFAQQSPEAIDAGVFHNDVISVGNGPAFLYHEKAFVDTAGTVAELRDRLQKHCAIDLIPMEVSADAVPLNDVVSSFLFNSQVLTLPDGSMAIVAPTESEETPTVKAALDRILADHSNPVQAVHYLNVRESMRNGGGPSCLRLRVVLTKSEIQNLSGRVLLDDALYTELKAWAEKHYREELMPDDLRDPALLRENREALDALSQILQVGSIYPFQGA